MSDMRAPLCFIVSLAIWSTGAYSAALPETPGESGSNQQAAGVQDQTPTYHASVTDVQVDADVIDGRRHVDGLTQQDFVILDENIPQRIVYFGHSSVPLEIVLLLDVSGSVQRYLKDIAAIARSALRKLTPQDQVAVMVFSRDTWIEQSLTNDPEEIAQAIEQASHEQPFGSGTRINAAVLSASKFLERNRQATIQRRAILIVTDNDGMSYGVRHDDVLRSLYTTDVLLDAIVVGRHPHPPVARPGAVINSDFAFDDVYPLAAATGGQVIAASKPEGRLAEVLERIRDRYSLVYHVPAAAQPGTYRHIRVQLSEAAQRKHPRAEVHARDGYYVNREEAKNPNEQQRAR
jgi:VWFA-related protein